MAASENTRYQINFRAGNALINVYAADQEEAEKGLGWVRSLSDEIASVQGLLDAAANVAAPGGGNAAPPAQRSAPPQQAAPQGDGGSCAHGPRQHKSGQKKNGGTWAAWMCPSRVQGCDPVWI